MSETRFSLNYCGIKETITLNTTGLTQEEIEEELVRWVLERVDHWSEDVKSK